MQISRDVLDAGMRAMQKTPREMIARNPDCKFYLMPHGQGAPYVFDGIGLFDSIAPDEASGKFDDPDSAYLAGTRRYAEKGFTIIAWSPTSGIVAVYNRPAVKSST